MRVLTPTFYSNATDTVEMLYFEDIWHRAQEMSAAGDLPGLYRLAALSWLDELERAQINSLIRPLQVKAVREQPQNPMEALGFVIPGQTLAPPPLRSTNLVTAKITFALAQRPATTPALSTPAPQTTRSSMLPASPVPALSGVNRVVGKK